MTRLFRKGMIRDAESNARSRAQFRYEVRSFGTVSTTPLRTKMRDARESLSRVRGFQLISSKLELRRRWCCVGWRPDSGWKPRFSWTLGDFWSILFSTTPCIPCLLIIKMVSIIVFFLSHICFTHLPSWSLYPPVT